jgi:signal transduction histidine kinase
MKKFALLSTVFFFIAALILLGIEKTSELTLKGNWNIESIQMSKQMGATIDRLFSEKLDQLQQLSIHVATDSLLLSRVVSTTPLEITQAFTTLKSYADREDVSIDIVDPRGNYILWYGRSVLPNYRNILADQSSDTIAFTAVAGVRSYLSFAVYVERWSFFIIVSTPLDINYPISNRYISPVRFSSQLSREVGTEVKLVADPISYKKENEWIIQPLRDSREMTILYALYKSPELSEALETLHRAYAPFISLMVALFCGALVGLIVVRTSHLGETHKIARDLLLCIFSGIVLHLVRFPEVFLSQEMIGTIQFRITSSLIQLTNPIDSLRFLLFLSFAVVTLIRHLRIASPSVSGSVASRIGVSVGMLVAITTILVFYLGVLRLFIEDSRFPFLGITEVPPSFWGGIMQFNVLLLSLSIIALQFSGILFLRSRYLRTLSMVPAEAIIFGVLLCSGFLTGWFFRLMTGNQYWDYAIIANIVLLGVLSLISNMFKITVYNWYKKTAIVLIILGYASFATVEAIYASLRTNDNNRIEESMSSISRPSHSGAAQRVNRILSETVDEISADLSRQEYSDDVANIPAFSVWANSQLGRKGYNSAISILDRGYRELSHFAVGLTYTDQQAALNLLHSESVFDTSKRFSAPRMIRKNIYATEVPIRSREQSITGFVLVMLSLEGKRLFRNELAEPLQMASFMSVSLPYRELVLSEYRNGNLFSTTDAHYAVPILSRDLLMSIEQQPNNKVFDDISISNKDFEIYYLQHPTTAGVVHAISLERIDPLLYFFFVGQLLMTSAVLLVLAWPIVWGFNRWKGIRFVPGFREKILISFGFLVLAPIFLLAYYNQNISEERLQETISTTLRRNLELVEQEIVSATSVPGNSQPPMSNEFCESIAGKLGIDFSVFTNNNLQATSRPELYEAQILDDRLNSDAFQSLVIRNDQYYEAKEKVGDVEYTVGYKPIYLRKRLACILVLPALVEQSILLRELSERNALLIGIYTIVFIVAALVGFFISFLLTKQLRNLRLATKSIAEGNLDIRLNPLSHDEIGDLERAFNEMASELKQKREEVKQAERELAWKEMAKQVAHEIKNPLTPMKLSVQHLLQAYRDGSPGFDKIFERVSKTLLDQIEALSKIATEFSRFARMPRGSFSKVDVVAAVRETIDLFREIEGISFQISIPQEECIVIADADELRRVFINVVRNSIQAIERNGTISCNVIRESTNCTITIADTGGGINKEILPKVMLPNFSTKSDGMGLGLSMSKKIVEELGGTIRIASLVGKGTTVTIMLPVCK